MNYVSHLFAGSEMMVFAASVLLQATLIIVLALLLGRWLRYQPALRHSVLLGGLMCVLFCPVATHLADRIGVPLISIAWPTTPASLPEVPAPAIARESAVVLSPDSVASPSEAPITLASLPPSDTGGQTERSPDVAESGSTFEPPVPEEVTGVSVAESVIALPDKTPNVLSGTEITHGPAWMNVANIAGLIWFIGMAVISARLLLAWRYLNRLRANAVPLDEQDLPQLRKVSEDVVRAVAAKRLPPLLVSGQLVGPFSLGISEPAIVLPREMTQTLNASQLRDVLIHETAHIHRRDHVVVLLQRLAGAIFWPFPLVWRLNAKIDEAREDVCDNYVISHTEASQYSRMLLELTERAATPQAIPLAIGLWKCPRKLEQRVVALLDPRRTTRTQLSRRTLCTLTVAFISIAVLLAGSRITPTNDAVAAESQQPTDEEATQPTKLEKKKDVTPAAKPVAVESKDQADPYHTLYDVIMTRYGKDGKAYGRDETSPSIFSWSEFPFDDKTFDKFDAALNAFAALPQNEIDEYSDVKRALLQRHLWKVFDTTFNWDWGPDWWWSGRKSFPKTHLDRRAAVQRPIVSLLRKLALTEAEILALPNPMAATLKGGGFAQAHDPADRFKPFLPADLYAKESSWICLGEDKTPIPASQHTSKSYSRSMFLQFVRLPGGRAETLKYLERIDKRPHQFPVGTQFALLEQPFLISKEGELVLSPMVASIQLRAYLNVGRRFSSSEDSPQVTQCVAEFVMQPRELMKGNAIMKAIGADDFRYDGGAPDSVGFNPRDPFEAGENGGRMPNASRLNQCMSCHGSAGGRGVRTRSFAVTNSFYESSVEEISKATSAQKRDSDDWKTLRALWQGKSLPKDDDAKMTAKVEPKKKPEKKLEKFPDTPELRESLVSRIESEAADELKKLHTAILLAETAKLSEMFQLEEAESNKLRVAAGDAAESAVEKTRTSLKTTVSKSSSYILNKKDIDKSAFTINDRFVRFAPKPNTRDSVKKTKEQNGSYIDADTGWWVDTTLNVEVERRAANVAISIGFQGSFVNRVGPQDTDVQNEEIWSGALAAVLTQEQLTQYKQHLQSRSKSTVVDMLLTALQFDLDLQQSQLPAVRKRVEERVNPDPSKPSSFIRGDIERTVAGYLQRLKAEDLADILTKEQLDQFPERSKSRIKSTIITLILRELQFDLHLPDSQLPLVRKQLEEGINPGELNYSIESAAMRIRWKMKGDVVADVLTEPQRMLWRFTQEQH